MVFGTFFCRLDFNIRCELLAPEIEGEFRPVSACVSVTVSDIPGELDALDNASL
jgi:hypothetical protein